MDSFLKLRSSLLKDLLGLVCIVLSEVNNKSSEKNKDPNWFNHVFIQTLHPGLGLQNRKWEM